MANLPAPPYDLSDCTVTLKDGTPTTITLFIDDGNVTWQVGRNIEYRLDRQKLSAVKEGDEIPLSVTFNCRFSEIASDLSDVSPFEFLTNSGAAALLNAGAGLVSTSSNICDRPVAIDIEVFADRNCSSGVDSLQDETITFPDFRYDTIDGDFNAGQLNVTGRCNAVLPTAARSAPV